MKEFEHFSLIDTPGLNDMQIPTADWGTRYNSSSVIAQGPTRIDLNLILFKCKIRPDFSDFNILAVLSHAVENFTLQNSAIIFTFADQDSEMDEEYAE